ncbi:MAG: Uma2 family endonuclease, partial [Elainellaceae cyanobacterium]
RNRYPDLTVIRDEHVEQLRPRNTIRLTMPPPLLVVEVVSPGEVQRNRDYIAKRSQYEDLSVPEYWIVNPQAGEILALTLNQTGYCETCFRREDVLRSPQLGDLGVTVAQVLAAGCG